MKPIRSKFGTMFFKGKQCSENCSGHLAGYEWADFYGVTKEIACIKLDQPESFMEGCASYINDRLEELRDELLKYEYDAQEEDLSCLPGHAC